MTNHGELFEHHRPYHDKSLQLMKNEPPVSYTEDIELEESKKPSRHRYQSLYRNILKNGL
jgi:hypothetical protein